MRWAGCQLERSATGTKLGPQVKHMEEGSIQYDQSEPWKNNRVMVHPALG